MTKDEKDKIFNYMKEQYNEIEDDGRGCSNLYLDSVNQGKEFILDELCDLFDVYFYEGELHPNRPEQTTRLGKYIIKVTHFLM